MKIVAVCHDETCELDYWISHLKVPPQSLYIVADHPTDSLLKKIKDSGYDYCVLHSDNPDVLKYYENIHKGIEALLNQCKPDHYYITPIDIFPVKGFLSKVESACIICDEKYGTDWVASTDMYYQNTDSHTDIRNIQYLDFVDFYNMDISNETVKVHTEGFSFHVPFILSRAFWDKCGGFRGLEGYDPMQNGSYDTAFSHISATHVNIAPLSVYHHDNHTRWLERGWMPDISCIFPP